MSIKRRKGRGDKDCIAVLSMSQLKRKEKITNIRGQEEPFAPNMISPFSNFKIGDNDVMELVMENGEIRTRGGRSDHHNSRGCLWGLYESDQYGEVHNRNSIDAGSDHNLADSHLVPVSSLNCSPPRPDRVSPEEHHKHEALKPKTSPNVSESMVDHKNIHPAPADKKTSDYIPPDEQSVAMVAGGKNTEKESRKVSEWWSTSKLSRASSSSMCSLGTSEAPICSLSTSYVDSEASTCPSTNLDESDDVKSGKRRRHELSERERRHVINKKLRTLQKLLPNSNKEDKAALLDEAIKYMRTLQLQIQFQMMLMARGLLVPSMIWPPANSSPMGLAMRFPPPPVATGGALPGPTNGVQMPRFLNHHGMMAMPMEASSRPSSHVPAPPMSHLYNGAHQTSFIEENQNG